MQNRTLWVVAGVLGILVLSGPIITGFVIERTHPMLIEVADESAPDVQIASTFDRGLFISTAETTLRFDGADESDILVIQHEIAHGPIPIGELWHGRSPLSLVVAVVDSRYEVDPEALPNVAAALDGQPLFRLVTWLGFDRSVRLALSSPPFELAEAGYIGGGLEGRSEFDPETGEASGEIHVAAQSLRDEDGSSLAIAPTEASFRVEPGEEGANPASGRVEVGAISFEGPASRVRVATSRATYSGTLRQGAFETGLFDLRVGDVHSEPITDAAAEPGELLGLRLVEESEFDEQRGLRSLTTTVTFDRLVSGADVYGPGRLVLAIRNVDVVAAGEFRDALAALDARAASDADALGARLALIEQFLPRLLGSSPEMVLEKFSVQSPHGELVGGGRVGIDGRDPAMLGSVLMALMQTRAVIEFSIPAPLMQTMVERYVIASVRDEMPEVSDEDLQQMAAMMRDTLLEQFVARGLLIRDGAVYRVDARFTDGMPSLNGQPIDPAMLPGFGGGA